MKTPLLQFLIIVTPCFQCQQSKVIFHETKTWENALLAKEGFKRCNEYTMDWLTFCDPYSGLIPENLSQGIDTWNAHNSAADNYPFMVLTTTFTNPKLYNGQMLDILYQETKLTSRIDRLPDTYSFRKRTFKEEKANLDRIIFGTSEYIKDGILPITEWLGKSPWSQRMINMLDDIWAHATVKTKFGFIPSHNSEVNGEQLQILSRIYWFTGDEKYLNWAIRLGDYYLLDNHPTRDFDALRLRDHGCEIVSGLCELYATVAYAAKEKKVQYQQPIYQMLDNILEFGRNEHGLFYNSYNPKTGEVINEGIADNWGYTLNGFYTVYLIDGQTKYRESLLAAFANLHHYHNFNWENYGADGFADAIEGALNLYNREPLPKIGNWIDDEMQILWSIQDSSFRPSAQKWKNRGIVEGWHGDGNFARTTIMYCLFKTQGTVPIPWREDLQWGAVEKNGELFLSFSTQEPWDGVLSFDTKRHKTILNLPIDWPRINQFPEWFTIDADRDYEIWHSNNSSGQIYTGAQLLSGLPLTIGQDQTLSFRIKPV